MTRELGGMIFPSGTKAHAATIDPDPMTAPFKITALIPIKQSFSTVAP
jgi:hypothetical protein